MSEVTENGSTALVSPQIAEALEKALHDVQEFIDSPQMRSQMQFVLTQQVAKSEELQRCKPESFALAIYQMFQLGLDPRGINEAFLVAYNGKAQLIAGYGGLIKLARDDKNVVDIFAKEVCKNDEYEIDIRTQQPLHLPPRRFSGERGELEGFYGTVCFTSGRWHTEEMSVEQMKAHRKSYSRSVKNGVWLGAWSTEFIGMGIKTMLRQITRSRHVRLAPAAQAVIAFEDTYLGRTKDVTPEASTYVPTHEEHVQNGNDVFGKPSASPEHYVPPPTPHKEGLGKTTARLYEDRDQEAPAGASPIKSVEEIRREAWTLTKEAAASCGANPNDLWDSVKVLAPKDFTPKRLEDLQHVSDYLSNAVTIYKHSHSAKEAVSPSEEAPVAEQREEGLTVDAPVATV